MAEAQFDVRLKSMADAPWVEARFAEIAARSWVPGTTTTLTPQMYHPPMERLPGTARLAALAHAIGASLGLALREVSNAGVSDASFATVAGVPTLCGLAPFGDDYHTRGEWLDLGTVPERVALVAGLVAGGQASDEWRSGSRQRAEGQRKRGAGRGTKDRYARRRAKVLCSRA
jgi:glutamate carboxypeptidase